MKFVIVTGLSGAGRSCALKKLEDIGFFCVDNLPPVLIPQFAELCLKKQNPLERVAVVIDMRTGDMFDDIYNAISELKKLDLQLEILFLDASDNCLISRFKQTRRKHPVSLSGKLIEGIFKERDSLQIIKEMADHIIDTTNYSTRQLASVIEKLYCADEKEEFIISVISFGFKRGIPLDADFVFDMRFIPNPFYIKELKHHTGKEKDVSDYVLSFDESKIFLSKIEDLVKYLLPFFMKQDKNQLVIGIGCTGGMHRSVAIAEELFLRLQNAGYNVNLEHRDIALEASTH